MITLSMLHGACTGGSGQKVCILTYIYCYTTLLKVKLIEIFLSKSFRTSLNIF